MAIVINRTNINTALESVFKDVSRTYTLYLRGLSEVALA